MPAVHPCSSILSLSPLSDKIKIADLSEPDADLTPRRLANE